MQLLIVDDEIHWVDNLSMNKPWHTLGIEQVHKAYSAREALELIDNHPIDIVISDILMPEMSGLELIEQIRSKDPKIKCVMLSGHSDFEYAKQAIRHSAVDYLLKPPTDEELLGAVGSAIEQLNKRRMGDGQFLGTDQLYAAGKSAAAKRAAAVGRARRSADVGRRMDAQAAQLRSAF